MKTAQLIDLGVTGMGTLIGGLASLSELRKLKSDLRNERNRQAGYYDRLLHSSPIEAKQARRAFRMAEDKIRQSRQDALGRARVRGVGKAADSAMAASGASALASAVADVDAAASARKAALEKEQLSNRREIDAFLRDLRLQKRRSIATAVSN